MEQNTDINIPAFDSTLLDTLLMGLTLEIDFDWGLSQLGQYLHEMSLIEKGISYSDLGISERRAATFPRVLTPQNGAIFISGSPSPNLPNNVPAGSIALLQLSGVMRAEDGLSSRGIKSLINDIQQANDNPNFKGIIIEANTGGGDTRAGNMLLSAVDSSSKPIVVWSHLLASAGINGTLAADEIIAAGDSAEFGSIGTYFTYNKQFKDWYNQRFQDVYASKSTNKNRPYREFLKGNMQPLQDSLDRSNELFLQTVAKYRQLTGDVEHTLSGEIFPAREAKKRGLIDSIGNLNYAINRVNAHAELRKNQSNNGKV